MLIKGPTNWKLSDVQNCWYLKNENVEIRRPKFWIHEKFGYTKENGGGDYTHMRT